MGLLFVMLSVLTVFFALGVVFLGKSPVHTAMFLVGAMLCLAVHFLMLGSQFLAFSQIIIYAGAIVVLFLFIIMLLNIRESDLAPQTQFTRQAGAIMLAIVLFYVLLQATNLPDVPVLTAPEQQMTYATAAETGTGLPSEIQTFATALLTRFLLPFELIAMLLLGAIVGALALGRRDPNAGKATPSASQ